MQQNKQFVKIMLAQYNIRPQKRLGQNFLINQYQINKIIKAAGLTKQDTVLEIGPGLGGLTLAIAQQAKQVIAIEKDKRLANALQDLLKQKQINNVKVVKDDALSDNCKLSGFARSRAARPTIWLRQISRSGTNCLASPDLAQRNQLISNLPYNIGVAIVMRFLEAENPPKKMIVLLQKEVGQRMVSKPPKMEKLAVFCQFYSQVKIVDYVSKENFFPKPKVDSVLMQFRPKPRPKINLALFAKIVKAGFQSPRKTLVNNLSKGLGLSKTQSSSWLVQNKISSSARAESLSINDWVNLTSAMPLGVQLSNY